MPSLGRQQGDIKLTIPSLISFFVTVISFFVPLCLSLSGGYQNKDDV